jgi:hypothetical protein
MALNIATALMDKHGNHKICDVLTHKIVWSAESMGSQDGQSH